MPNTNALYTLSIFKLGFIFSGFSSAAEMFEVDSSIPSSISPSFVNVNDCRSSSKDFNFPQRLACLSKTKELPSNTISV